MNTIPSRNDIPSVVEGQHPSCFSSAQPQDQARADHQEMGVDSIAYDPDATDESLSILSQIHPTPLWIEDTPQGKVAYFDDENSSGKMPERKFSISPFPRNETAFKIRSTKNEKSFVISHSSIKENHWHLLRALDGFEISRNPDKAMVAQWQVYNGEHDQNGTIIKPGIRLFHGTGNENAWEHIETHGVTVEGTEKFSHPYRGQYKTFASSSYEVALTYSGMDGRVGRFIGKRENFTNLMEENGFVPISYWPSEHNVSFETAQKNFVLPRDSTLNDDMYVLNHQEMQRKIPEISRDQTDRTLRETLSRTDLRGIRKRQHADLP